MLSAKTRSALIRKRRSLAQYLTDHPKANLKEMFKLEKVSLVDFFRYPTVRKYANFIVEKYPELSSQ